MNTFKTLRREKARQRREQELARNSEELLTRAVKSLDISGLPGEMIDMSPAGKISVLERYVERLRALRAETESRYAPEESRAAGGAGFWKFTSCAKAKTSSARRWIFGPAGQRKCRRETTTNRPTKECERCQVYET